MVAVALFGLGAGGVNLERERAVGGEFALAFGDQLAQGLARAAFVTVTPRVGVAAVVTPREPEARSVGVWPGPPAVPTDKPAPAPPPRQPRVSVIITAIAPAIEPIVLARTEIHVVIIFAEDFVGDGCVGHGAPK